MVGSVATPPPAGRSTAPPGALSVPRRASPADNDMLRALEYLEHRLALAQNPALRGGSRRWCNDIKIAVIWSAWLLPWLHRQSGEVYFNEWSQAATHTITPTPQSVGLAGVNKKELRVHMGRLHRWGYVRRPRPGAYNLGARGRRCGYEYAIWALLLREKEQPGDMLLKPPALYPGYSIQRALIDGL